MDKKETKIEKSKGRARVVQDRSKDWHDQNKKLEALKAAQRLLEKENGDWVDDDESDDEDSVAIEGDAEMEGNLPNPVSAVATETPLPAVTEEEEEIL